MADDNVKKLGVTSIGGASVAPAAASGANDNLDEYNEVRKEMKERFELLPDDIKVFMTGEAYQRGLFDIAKAQKLTYEELGTLETDTSLVLLGMTPPMEYREDLERDLMRKGAELDALVQTVNEKIFAPIKASLERIYAAKRDPSDFLEEPKETAPIAPVSTPMASTPTANIAGVPATPAAAAPTFAPTTSQTFAAAPKMTVPVAPKPAPTLSSTEKTLLEKTGVVISETPVAAPSAPIASRSDLLQSIENPTKAPVAAPQAAPTPGPAPMFTDRLKSASPVMPATKTTDYSIGKITPAATPQTPAAAPIKTADPYREPIN